MSLIRRVGVLAGAAALTTALTIAAPTTTSAADIPHVLYAGQSAEQLRSSSGEFWLFTSNILQEQQESDNFGMDVWGTPYSKIDLRTGKLTMQRNGDLVLRDYDGHVRWHTNTDGTGTNNRFAIFNSGNLAVVTAAGKRVWQSGSGRTFLVSGMRLESGQSLRSRYTTKTPWARLTMRTTGNLVLTYGGDRRWSSHTYVAGSRLVGRSNGNWVIVAPSGRTVWSFHTAVNAHTRLEVGPAGTAAQLTIEGPRGILFERVR